MIKFSSKTLEFNHFTNLSKEWWNPSGKFQVLHALTPLRIRYIKEILDKNNNKIINKLNVLDLGCGGGLVCEPLARLGANVTGIDFIQQNIEVAKKHAYQSDLNIKYIYQKFNRFESFE